ncbi:hypothetical protein CASFOL_010196 [Castilleja foliolosa]|uniref:F-box protein n=1 Tax=Castilleja foliolosa TaxID=1961234 RepID=A0ABD3DTC8_9LAMI
MAGEGEIQFAEPIIHRLQSILTGKEAAQTTIVSKSWHSAWLTRPNLDFDDTYFGEYNCYSVDKFKNHAKKTIKRYEQSNLKIESFHLCMQIDQYGRDDLAKKLIVKALRIGATRLCLRLSKNNEFVLPNEVFGADNLVELSVSGCRIDLDDGVDIKCRKLESLSLDDDMHISIDTVSKIVSSCPCIEKFSLLSNFYQENEFAWGVSAWGRAVDTLIPNDEKAVGLVDTLIPKLRCLVLGYVPFKTLCLGDLLFRFPFLKDFTLYINYKCCGHCFEEGLQISNCSLERIKLVLQGFECCVDNRKPRVKFDVPSVRKFTFEGAVIPGLSFTSTPPSREWESHVSIIKCPRPEHGFSTIWFNELSELLTELSRSKTHLSLNVGCNMMSIDYKAGNKIIQGLHKHELENLSIDMTNLPSLSCYALFDGLFRLCSPKLITQCYKDGPDKQLYNYCHMNDSNYMEKTNIDLLCQILEEGVNFKVSRPTRFMYGLNDLEEVNAQAFDMNDVPAEWKPIPFESLLDADTPYKHVQAKIRTRLLLKWKPI